MSDVDSDEELKRAIALSLQEVSPTLPKQESRDGANEVINLLSSSEEEDDDLDAPVIAERLKKSFQNPARKKVCGQNSSPPTLRQESSVDSKKCLINDAKSSQKSASASDNPSTSYDNHVRSVLQSLDRKKMEEERLARLRNLETKEQNSAVAIQSTKRKASLSSLHPDEEARLATRKKSPSTASRGGIPESKGNMSQSTVRYIFRWQRP